MEAKNNNRVPTEQATHLSCDMEAKEKINRQELFKHLNQQHGLTLLDSELNDIYSICLGHDEYVKMLNFILNHQALDKAKELLKAYQKGKAGKLNVQEILELDEATTAFLEGTK